MINLKKVGSSFRCGDQSQRGLLLVSNKLFRITFYCEFGAWNEYLEPV